MTLAQNKHCSVNKTHTNTNSRLNYDEHRKLTGGKHRLHATTQQDTEEVEGDTKTGDTKQK